jgi:hypothetical protein
MNIYEQHMAANPGLDRKVYTREYWDDLIAGSWSGVDYRIPTVPPVESFTYRDREGNLVGPLGSDLGGYLPNGRYSDEDLCRRDLVVCEAKNMPTHK